MDRLQNKGWEQMNALLDLEMPTKRRRKRFLWLPILLGALLVTTALIVASGGFSTKSTESEQVQESQTPIEKTEPAATRLVPEDEESFGGPNISGSQPDHPETSPTANRQQGGSTVRAAAESGTPLPGRHQRSVEISEQNATIKDTYTTVEEPSPSIDGRVSHNVVDRNLDSGDEIHEKEQIESLEESAKPHSTFNVELLGTDGLSLITVPGIDPSPVTPSSSFKSTWGMDVYGASHLTTSSGLRGVELGILANVSVAPRWKVNFGLGYGHYNNDGLIRIGGRSEDQFNVIDPGTIPDTTSAADVKEVIQDVNYDTAFLLVERFDYLHLPVFVEYRATRWLNLVTGMRLSYLMSAPIVGSSQRILYPTSFNTVADNRVAKSALLDEQVVRRWDIVPLVGLSAHIGRRLAIDVQYQFGLIPYIDRPAVNREDYNRSLSVGIRVKLL